MDKQYTAVLWDPDTLRIHIKVTNSPRHAYLLKKPRKINRYLSHLYGDYPHIIYVAEGDITSSLQSMVGHLQKKLYWKLEPEFLDAINQFKDVTHKHILPLKFGYASSIVMTSEWINEFKILSRVRKHVDADSQQRLTQKLYWDLLVRDIDGKPRRQ